MSLRLDYPGRAPFAALETASGPVVVERAGYAIGKKDLVASMGIPVGSGAN